MTGSFDVFDRDDFRRPEDPDRGTRIGVVLEFASAPQRTQARQSAAALFCGERPVLMRYAVIRS